MAASRGKYSGRDPVGLDLVDQDLIPFDHHVGRQQAAGLQRLEMETSGTSPAAPAELCARVDSARAIREMHHLEALEIL